MCFMQTLNTNITMQHAVTTRWIDVSGYSFNMNTIHEFAAKTSKCWKKLAVSFK